jgi:hypothetical protein
MSMVEVINLQNENQKLRTERAQLLAEIDVLRQSLADWAGPEATNPDKAMFRVILSGTQGFAFSDAEVPLAGVQLAKDQLGTLAFFAKGPAEACAQSFLQNMGILAAPKIILPN